MRERFFIGDAAHTHSSDAAQGLNTGLHDAINLAWKFSGTIKGQIGGCVLDWYDRERREMAENIIAQDKILSLLTEGKIPEEMENDQDILVQRPGTRILMRIYSQLKHYGRFTVWYSAAMRLRRKF